MGPAVLSDGLPTTLTDLLSNTLVLRQTAPYLPVSALRNLSRTSKSLHRILLQSPEVFRYLDLSPVKSAVVPFDGPLDAGGINWRAERMDEALSEDEFYSGPLRGIFSRLEKLQCLRNVHTMVLDGLSVTAELVQELLTEERYNVRILSIREAKNMNERKLQQYLRYAVRPSRPVGTPRVKGLYFFGPRNPTPLLQSQTTKKRSASASRGVMSSQGAQIGAEWNQKSSDALNAALARTEDKWYQPSGKMISKRPTPEWAEVLQACEGIIAFDAVLCRGPRHDPARACVREGAIDGHLHPASFLRPAIANVALGPSGCESCESCPEGPAVFGHSPPSQFPLLSPVPLHGSSVRAAQIPHCLGGAIPPPLHVRCEDCLKGRWCEWCNKWWDENCYVGSVTAQRTELQQTELTESIQADGTSLFIPKQIIKVLAVTGCGDRWNDLGAREAMVPHRSRYDVVGFWKPVPRLAGEPDYWITASKARLLRAKVIGVFRDCFCWGHTCISCKELLIGVCKKCKGEYCYDEDDGSSDTMCDWCNYTSRRTREIY